MEGTLDLKPACTSGHTRRALRQLSILLAIARACAEFGGDNSSSRVSPRSFSWSAVWGRAPSPARAPVKSGSLPISAQNPGGRVLARRRGGVATAQQVIVPAAGSVDGGRELHAELRELSGGELSGGVVETSDGAAPPQRSCCRAASTSFSSKGDASSLEPQEPLRASHLLAKPCELRGGAAARPGVIAPPPSPSHVEGAEPRRAGRRLVCGCVGGAGKRT